MRRINTFVLILVLSSFSQMFGQRNRDKWEFSFQAGWSGLSDKSYANSIEGGGTQLVGVDTDSGLAFSLGITDNFLDQIGAELEYSFSNHDSLFSNLSPNLPLLPFNQKLHKFTYSAIIYPTDRRRNKLYPYAIVGVGAAYFQSSTDNDLLALASGVDLRNRWTFDFVYGGGVKMKLNRRWGVRAEFKNHMVGVPDYGFPRQSPVIDGIQGAAFRPDGTYNNWTVTAGLIYFWRRR